MNNVVQGIVHGNAIELKEPLGVPDGQEVEILVKLVQKNRTPGEGLLRTEGALADDEEWDVIMDEIHKARRLDRRSVVADLGDA